MRKFTLVLKHEISTTLRRRSFQFWAFGLPFITVLIFIVSFAVRSNTNRANRDTLEAPGAAETHDIPIESLAFVDISGFIEAIPDPIPESSLRFFPDQIEANQAVNTGQIEGYFIIPEDFIQTGKFTYVQSEFNPFTAQTRSQMLQWLLQVNLLGGDAHLAKQYKTPLDLQVTLLEDQLQKNQNDPLTFFLPFTITLFFYITILMSASLLLSSITKEKENRMLEILLVSTTPRQILSGKILGLGVVGLIQTAVWFGTGYVLLQLSGNKIQLPFEIQLPISFFGWVLLFFILGYGLYASLMASIGALVTNLREASQLAFALLLPMLIPLLTIGITMRDPNGAWVTALSIFPFTAPVAMLTRLATVYVPLWQTFLAIALMTPLKKRVDKTGQI